jgi:hypothetical protein
MNKIKIRAKDSTKEICRRFISAQTDRKISVHVARILSMKLEYFPILGSGIVYCRENSLIIYTGSQIWKVPFKSWMGKLSKKQSDMCTLLL